MAIKAKTTLYLPEMLRRRLKATAAQRDTTVSALLAEGADLVLARYEGSAQRTELVSRAAEARRRLREGLYSGIPVAGKENELAYGIRKKGRGPTGKRDRRDGAR